MNQFSKWLVKYRKASGLSLRELEKAINKICTFGYINQLEKGTAGKKQQGWQPDIEIVEALAVALNRPINEARNAAGYALVAVENGNNDTAALLRDIDGVSPERRAMAIKIARSAVQPLKDDPDFDFNYIDD